MQCLVPTIVTLVLGLFSATAGAVDTTIGFEDLADGTAVGAQYSGLGVQLDKPSDLSVETNVFPHQGAKVLRATDHVGGPGTQVSFTGLLSSPRTTVAIWVHYPYTIGNAYEVSLTGYNAANAQVGLTSASVSGNSGWVQLSLIIDPDLQPGITIDHFTVSVETGIPTMLFDDLSFNAGAGDTPSVTWENTPTQPVAVERGGTTNTTATLRRRGGSTGRVDLSVSGLPTGVSAVVAPAQANGSDLRSTVSVALTATAGAPITPGPVTATLRAVPVDGTAGTSTPVTTTFPVTVPAPYVSVELTGAAPDGLYRGDAITLPARLVRHSLSSGLVKLAVTGPKGVTMAVSPTTIDGAAGTTPVSITATVPPGTPRDPDGVITVTATSDDAAAQPAGTPAQLKVTAPLRVPEIYVGFPKPLSPVLRAGGGTIGVDTVIEATDLPPGTVVTSGIRDLPKDVKATAAPESWPASDGTKVFRASLTADGNAGSGNSRPTIWAHADVPGRGALDDATGFPLTVVAKIRYALAARGIEVTQGTQTDGPGCDSIPTRDFLHIDSSVPYKGVKLVDGDLTVARVFVSAYVLSNATSIPGVDVRLHAFRAGREIPGSPISPIAKPAAVKAGDAGCVTAADRAGADNVYTYALPPSWTFGTVTLQAEILPLPPSDTGAVLEDCNQKFCQTLKRFTLRNIGFNRITWPGIQPIKITGDGADPGNAEAATYGARMLLPGNPYLWGYQGTVDVSDLIAAAPAILATPFFANLTRRDIIEGGAASRVKLWAAALQGRSIVAGIAPSSIGDIAGVANGRHISDLPASVFGARPSLVLNTIRPLTSTAHELSHIVGRPHAGQDCDKTRPGEDQEGEVWAPDDRGYLQGIGLDLWSLESKGFTATASEPYRVIARGLKDRPAEFYDLMSYCAAANDDQDFVPAPDAWLSPRGWDDTVGWLTAYTKRTGGATGVARAAAVPVPVLSVSAIGRGAAALLVSVAPGRGTPLAVDPAGPVLVGYDAAGAEVTRAGVSDEVSEDTGLHTYSGSVAAAGVARLALLNAAGATLAERTQSASAPQLTLTAPRAGATVGGTRAVRVAWTASDADGGTLTSTVEASADDGASWRQIYDGPTSAATLPAAYFAGSAKARVRVTVNDGFRSTSVVSARFRTLQPPASVQIDAPLKGARVNSDGSLALSGSASTVAGPVASRRLVWRLDGRQIATGARAAARDLPPGRRTLTLSVRGDARAKASVVVVVRAVTPRFLKVTLPRRVGRTARVITVRLRSGTAATVRAGGASVRIKARKGGVLRVPITPGSGEVVLTFQARALGERYTFTRAVRR